MALSYLHQFEHYNVIGCSLALAKVGSRSALPPLASVLGAPYIVWRTVIHLPQCQSAEPFSKTPETETPG